MFQHCETNSDKPNAFQDFMKEYTILQAIQDIIEGWSMIPDSTIIKSFKKVFPREKWAELTGGSNDTVDELTGGSNATVNDPACVVRLLPVTDDGTNIPGHNGIQRTQIINDEFNSDIEDILHNLNQCNKDIHFQKDHVIEDVLLNPGPEDENIDTMIRDVLQVQDTVLAGEDMHELEVDPAQPHQSRSIVLNALGQISSLKYGDITGLMVPHQLKAWKELMTQVENAALDCFKSTTSTTVANAPTTDDFVPLPSTSGETSTIHAPAPSPTHAPAPRDDSTDSDWLNVLLKEDTIEDDGLEATTFRASQ